MFRVKTTRRNIKRALSPLKPALDPTAPPTNVLVEAPAPSAPAPSLTSEMMEKQDRQMTDLFAAEAASVSLTKPWLRLERGIRMQKLRSFADNYEGLSPEDRDSLYKFLVRANDSKLLNTKQQIQYEHGSIQTIKGLKITRTGDPTQPAVFKIDVHRATKRNTSD